MNNLNHIAIIMDGNGTWAKKQGLPRTMGHKAGTEKVKEIALYANSIGIKHLTLYSFSTENWKRPEDEVNYLMSVPGIFYKSYIKLLMKNNIKVTMIGTFDNVPEETTKIIKKMIDETKNNTGLDLCLAFNYGGRDEIVRACNKAINDVKIGVIDKVDESNFENYLMTKDKGDVDLMIRTSGKCRISNYLLWQLAYSEMIFIDKCWPDFTPKDLDECIDIFNGVKRNFGGL